jgi:alpha-1,2-glucosyltransferase
LLTRLWPLAAVPAAFAAFAVVNGGIVVGDKAAHAPARHLVQPLYFAAYAVRRPAGANGLMRTTL